MLRRAGIAKGMATVPTLLYKKEKHKNKVKNNY